MSLAQLRNLFWFWVGSVTPGSGPVVGLCRREHLLETKEGYDSKAASYLAACCLGWLLDASASEGGETGRAAGRGQCSDSRREKAGKRP